MFADIYVMPWGRTCHVLLPRHPSALAYFSFGSFCSHARILPIQELFKGAGSGGKELLESRLSALREGNPNMDFELRTAPPLHSNCGMLSLVTTSGTP